MIEEFETLPELTDEQLREINSIFLPYIFYSKIKVKKFGTAGVSHAVEVYDCTCTHCRASYTHDFEGARHKSRVTCPHCGVRAQLRSKGMGHKKLYEERRVVITCPVDHDTVWFRAFYAFKSYQNSCDPSVELSETTRYLLHPKQVKCFRFDYSYFSMNDWSVCNQREPFTQYMQAQNYEVLGLNRLEETFMKYLDADQYIDYIAQTGCSNRYIINVYLMRFICDFCRYPIIESLLKAGFEDFVKEKIVSQKPYKRMLNWDAAGIKDFFKKLSPPEIRHLRDEHYQALWLTTHTNLKKIEKSISPEFTSQILKKYFSVGTDTIIDICKKYNISIKKADKYLSKQSIESMMLKPSRWKDYLDIAAQIGYDLTCEAVLMPKDLQTAHDTVSKILTAKMREQEAQEMRERTEQVKKKYAFEFGELQIVVPERISDIVEEGQKLQHCVAGYAERHAKGALTILFVRKKSELDKPYVTMEVTTKDTIRQVHGFRNDAVCPLSEEVKEFVEEFKKYIKNPKAYKRSRQKLKKSA